MRNLIAPKIELKVVKEEGTSYTVRIASPNDLAIMMGAFLEDQPQERFIVAPVNTKNQVMGIVLIYQGTVDTINVRVAEVIRPAILMNASAIFIAHNHPSGNPAPSPEDVKVTQDINEACKLMGFELLDHIIMGDEGKFYSFKEHGLVLYA